MVAHSVMKGLAYTPLSAHEPKKYPVMIPNSTVMSTIIGTLAKELQSLRPNVYTRFRYPGWVGTSITEDIPSEFSLEVNIEELFKNVTVNLMTSPMLQPNVTFKYARPATNITFPTYGTVYDYSVVKLWIAYGLAIGFSTVCVAAGLATVVANGAYCTADFSTVLRALQASHLSVEIEPTDADSKYPLPNYISAAKIAFQGNKWGKNSAIYREVEMASYSLDTDSRARFATASIEN